MLPCFVDSAPTFQGVHATAEVGHQPRQPRQLLGQADRCSLAATAAVRLPHPAISLVSFNLVSINSKAARSVLAVSTTRRGQQRADQSRYHAKCRVAMGF